MHHINDDNDKKFASQAVAFVIKHSCNGLVSLCASIATLLQEQAKLRQEIQNLQCHINNLKILRSSDNSTKKSSSVNNDNEYNFNSDPIQKLYLGKKIQGCSCNKCSYSLPTTAMVPPLNEGQTVIIRGELCGKVLYIGHIDNIMYDLAEIYVGLQLDEPIGNTNGTVEKKMYFTCPINCGMFVPLSHILCVIK